VNPVSTTALSSKIALIAKVLCQPMWSNTIPPAVEPSAIESWITATISQWAFSDSYMEAEAARLGLGLAYVPVELVADDLERGTLIRVLQRYSLRMDGLFLYYPHRNVSPALRAVIDTLKI